jgi:hypothetical protein
VDGVASHIEGTMKLLGKPPAIAMETFDKVQYAKDAEG